MYYMYRPTSWWRRDVQSCLCPQLRPPAAMNCEVDIVMKEYVNMMADIVVLCATLALSLFFWLLSISISSYYGEGAGLLRGQVWCGVCWRSRWLDRTRSCAPLCPESLPSSQSIGRVSVPDEPPPCAV